MSTWFRFAVGCTSTPLTYAQTIFTVKKALTTISWLPDASTLAQVRLLFHAGFYPGINMRGCESQGGGSLPEARRAEGRGWGSWGGWQRAGEGGSEPLSPPDRGSRDCCKLPQQGPWRISKKNGNLVQLETSKVTPEIRNSVQVIPVITWWPC